MGFPQFNAGNRIASLANRILSTSSPEDSKKLFFSLKGGLLRNRLKKKLVESGEIEKISPFLLEPPKSPNFMLPNREKTLKARFAKWQQISDNLDKMDSVILKEYRERRAEFKTKNKKNKNPF